VRAVALHADIISFVSDVWQTTCTAVRGGEEGFVIDSPVYPEELRALPEVLEHAGFPVSGLLSTHGDWDHLLARTAFPDAPLGCGQSTADRLAAEPGTAQRELRDFDQEHYVTDRPPLALGSLQVLPVPGRLELGSVPDVHEVQLHPTGGHTPDGTAFLLPWAGVLVVGDYLSPVEIPMLSPGGSIPAYRATLARLRELCEQAEWVIPGHGAPYRASQALELLEEDDRYLELLATDPEQAGPPVSRSTRQQGAIHAENLRRLRGEPEPPG
jgi:glyoxylase-like metal-dependent hydrolase (beta-lactamase superfamily II)